MSTKHAATSKTNYLGLGMILASGFNIYQDAMVGGLAAIGSPDVLIICGGIGVIVNRLSGAHPKLHIIAD